MTWYPVCSLCRRMLLFHGRIAYCRCGAAYLLQEGMSANTTALTVSATNNEMPWREIPTPGYEKERQEVPKAFYDAFKDDE